MWSDQLTIGLQLYPSADAVIIRDVETLDLRRILAFWEAFPGTIHADDAISCISVDSGMKLVRGLGNDIGGGDSPVE